MALELEDVTAIAHRIREQMAWLQECGVADKFDRATVIEMMKVFAGSVEHVVNGTKFDDDEWYDENSCKIVWSFLEECGLTEAELYTLCFNVPAPARLLK